MDCSHISCSDQFSVKYLCCFWNHQFLSSVLYDKLFKNGKQRNITSLLFALCPHPILADGQVRVTEIQSHFKY